MKNKNQIMVGILFFVTGIATVLGAIELTDLNINNILASVIATVGIVVTMIGAGLFWTLDKTLVTSST